MNIRRKTRRKKVVASATPPPIFEFEGQASSVEMAAAATTSSALSMKLLVDTKAQRVLFAEAGKDVVDFLFSLLALPVGTAVKLLGKDSMVGCVGNLYGSVEKLDGTYVQPGAAKDALLHPVVLSPGAAGTNMLGMPEATSGGQSRALYKCSHCSSSCVSETSSTNCPSCGYKMTTALRFVSGSGGQTGQAASGVACGKGFVQGIVTYTVMDNLNVNPMSSISSIALLNTFAVKDLGALQEKTVQLGYKEVRHLHLAPSPSGRRVGPPMLLTLLCMIRFAGSGDSEGVAAVQDRPHRRLPRQEAAPRPRLNTRLRACHAME